MGGGSDEINTWEIIKIDKEKKLISVKNDAFGVRTERIGDIRRWIEDVQQFEEEQKNNPQPEKKERAENGSEQKVGMQEKILPFTQLMAAIGPKSGDEGKVARLEGWMNKWFYPAKAGEEAPIDSFRKEHGTIEVDTDALSFVEEALPKYVEALKKIPTLSQDRKTSMFQTVQEFVRILIGIQHPELNDIEPTLTLWKGGDVPIGDYELVLKDFEAFENKPEPQPASKPARGRA